MNKKIGDNVADIMAKFDIFLIDFISVEKNILIFSIYYKKI
jgi:hypothetical protein